MIFFKQPTSILCNKGTNEWGFWGKRKWPQSMLFPAASSGYGAYLTTRVLKLLFFTRFDPYNFSWCVKLLFKINRLTNCAVALVLTNKKVTLYNAILRIARNFLETRRIIKISTHPFYHVNLDWFSWEWSKKKFFFGKKKSKPDGFQSWPFFKIANSQNFFVKISQIRPWVSRIAWCEGHWSGSTYMVVRLSDISSKTG